MPRQSKGLTVFDGFFVCLRFGEEAKVTKGGELPRPSLSWGVVYDS